MIELCKRAGKGCTSDGTLCRQFAYLLDKWISVEKELPKEDGGYLVTMDGHCAEVPTYIAFADFTKDLYTIDNWEFRGKKNIAGFYDRSIDGEVYVVNPIAWQPLPEPYKEVTK